MEPTAVPRGSKSWLVPAITVLACGLVAFLVLGNRLWFHDTMRPAIQRQVNGLVPLLRAVGLNVSDPQVGDGIEGVEQVVVVQINGKPIRLLELDGSKDAAAKEIARIQEKGVTGLQGAEQPAEVEGVIVILDFDRHPDKEKILEAFHKKAAGAEKSEKK